MIYLCLNLRFTEIKVLMKFLCFDMPQNQNAKKVAYYKPNNLKFMENQCFKPSESNSITIFTAYGYN